MVDLSASALIKSGSGMALILLGAYFLARKQSHDLGMPLGLYLASLGAALTVFNLFRADPRLAVAADWTFSALTIVLLAGLVVFAARFPTLVSLRDRGLMVVAGLAFLVSSGFLLVLWVTNYTPSSLAALFGVSLEHGWSAYTRNVLFQLHYALAAGILLFLSLRQRGLGSDLESRRRTAWAVAGLAPYYAFETAEKLFLPGMPSFAGLPSLTFVIIVLSLTAIAWIPRRDDPLSKTGRNVSLWILSILCFTLVFVSVTTAQSVYDGPISAAARFAGILILCVALFRANVFGEETLLVRHRGTFAAAGFATMFVLAEIAQNIVSSEVSLLAGGAVAGAILLLGQRLERRARLAEVATDAQETYRDALRLALSDGKLTAAERRHLLQLRVRLGLQPSQADLVQRQVLQESRGN